MPLANNYVCVLYSSVYYESNTSEVIDQAVGLAHLNKLAE